MLAFVINPRNGVPRSVMTEHRNSTLAFAAYSLFYGAAHAAIDNAAHIGGLLGGFLIGLVLAHPLDHAHRGSSGGRQSFVAAGVGLLALATLSYPLLHPSDAGRRDQAFQSALMVFPAEEHRAVQAMQSAQTLAAGKTGGGAFGFAQIMKFNAYPQWNAMYNEIAAPKLASDHPLAKRQSLLLRYIDGRRRFCQLIARAVSENDEMIAKQAKAADQDASVAVAELNQLNARSRH